MESRKIKFVFSFFQSCGFCHFNSYDKTINKKTEQYMFICCFFQFLILSTIISVTIYYSKVIFITHGIISIATDILQWMFPVISLYLIFFESIRTRNVKFQFWKRVEDIDKCFLGTSAKLQQRLINIYIFKAITLVTATMVVNVYLFIAVQALENWRNHMLATIYIYSMCRFQLLLCVLFVMTLECRIKMLSYRLKEVQSKTSRNRINLVRCCKKASETMWLCVQDINKSFGKMEFSPTFPSLFDGCIGCVFHSHLYWWTQAGRCYQRQFHIF